MSEKSEEDSYIEVAILVDGRKLTCDRNTLVKESDYFRAMFDSSMIESQTNTVTLQDQDFEDVCCLVKCMECGDLTISEDNAPSLTQTAVMLQIPRAIDSCCAYFVKTLDHSNCLELYRFSKSLALSTLYNQTKRHALYYFVEVSNSETFCDLGLEEIIEYLSDRHVNCDSELDIVNAIHKWYKHDSEYRESGLEKLMGCIQHDDLYEEEWTSLKDHQLITKTKAGTRWFENVTKERETASNPNILEKYRHVPMCFLTVGGVIPNPEREDCVVLCTNICKFDEAQKRFVDFQSLEDVYDYYEMGRQMGFQVTVVGKDMYLTGGQPKLTRERFITEVWRFDGFEKTWEDVSTLPLPRRHHGTCASNTELYLMGGFGKHREILQSFQKYDTVTRDWETLPPVPVPCFSPVCLYTLDKIYLSKQDIYCFNFNTQSWTKLTLGRQRTNIVYIPMTHKGQIYRFPFIDLNLDWFYEFNELAFTVVQKYNENEKELCVLEHSDELQFGNRVVICNGKVYMINRYDDKFVHGYVEDLKQHKVLGDGSNTGSGAFLVALPDYPDYKVNKK